jgi:2-methylcitrate dehydratase PrpD
MSNEFLERLCNAVLKPEIVTTAQQRRLIARAVSDTMAVAAAGFPEAVTRNVLAAYGGDGPRAWSGERCESVEAAILVNGVASHALDFDDVYLESMAHISTVLLPAVLRHGDDDPDEVIAAFAAGLVAAKAVARRVGPGHYHKGFHGTGTIGTFAAAAACGRLARLEPSEMANAFAIAASLSSGIQANFSTQTKPAHAGFAATAGFRAVRLAKEGVTGSRTIFSERGYPDLYGVNDGEAEPKDDAFELRPDLISVKLFPCCYASHRLVGIALDARAELGNEALRPDARYRLTVPEASISLLRHDRPRDGMQAKFSATYTFAVAMLKGTPTLADFLDEAVGTAAVSDIIDRLEIVEDATQPSGGDIEFGQVSLEIQPSSGASQNFVRAILPGSPLDPPEPEALREKLASCLDIYERWSGQPFPLLAQTPGLGAEVWLPTAL